MTSLAFPRNVNSAIAIAITIALTVRFAAVTVYVLLTLLVITQWRGFQHNAAGLTAGALLIRVPDAKQTLQPMCKCLDPILVIPKVASATLTIEKVREVPLPNGSFTYEWRVAGQKYNPLGGGSFAYSSVKPLGLESPVVTGNATIITGVGGGNCDVECNSG